MKKRVLILGVTGMLGHTLFSKLSENKKLDVFATARSLGDLSSRFPPHLRERIRTEVDANNFDSIIRALASIKPNIVINCIGLIKQIPIAGDPLNAITVNAQLPHRISLVCCTAGARMIHISSDCVFSGNRGNYSEENFSDAEDIYGRTKFLGEVSYPHCITLRTSIIGHELKGNWGLVGWFLSQKEKVRGFTHAIYTGFPTIELARIITEFILPNDKLSGLYHVSTDPISKHDLIKIVAKEYGKKIQIDPYADFKSDRSLNSTKFHTQTGYKPPSWDKLIKEMHADYCQAFSYKEDKR